MPVWVGLEGVNCLEPPPGPIRRKPADISMDLRIAPRDYLVSVRVAQINGSSQEHIIKGGLALVCNVV